jgi:hypothetical protein
VVVVFNYYGGISEQVFCNDAVPEKQSLYYWVNIYGLTPHDYSFDYVWHLYWSSHSGVNELRRDEFESVYGFTYGERFDPLFQEMRPVTIIGNYPYFNYLVELVFQQIHTCVGKAFPVWP